jgi:lipoprotein signal peptidase
VRTHRARGGRLTAMFMLYSVAIGLVLGLLLGGRIGRLADIHFEWLWLALAALMVQFVLFTEPFWTALGGLGPPIYVASTALVLVVVLRNLRALPGLALVALGTVSNLAAIIANGGYMPVTAEALGIAEPTVARYGGNSVLTPNPMLTPLVDRFPLPEWLPLWNVFSIGDVLISVGVIVVIVMAMRKRQPVAAETSPAGPARMMAPSVGPPGDVPAP